MKACVNMILIFMSLVNSFLDHS